MAEKFLNGAKISTVGEQMRRERVTQRMRMQIPVDVGDANVFFDDAPDGALRKAPAGIIEKDRFGVRPLPATRPIGLLQELFAQRPIFFQRFLGLSPVRNDAFLAALAADAKDAFPLLHVGKIEAGEFADAQARGVKEFQERPVAAKEQAFFSWHRMTPPAWQIHGGRQRERYAPFLSCP